MDPTTWIVIGAAIAAFVIYKRCTMASPQTAREWLKSGARVIDVRSREEYQGDHIPGAINIPLGELRDGITPLVPDKDQPLLLHCLSGGRSGIGKGLLKRMGYRKVLNLGSLSRARRIVSG